jgi:hypothetical protein
MASRAIALADSRNLELDLYALSTIVVRNFSTSLVSMLLRMHRRSFP